MFDQTNKKLHRVSGSDRTSGEGDLESGQAIGVGHIEQPTEFVFVAILVLDVVNGSLYDLMAAQFLVRLPLLQVGDMSVFCK